MSLIIDPPCLRSTAIRTSSRRRERHRPVQPRECRERLCRLTEMDFTFIGDTLVGGRRISRILPNGCRRRSMAGLSIWPGRLSTYIHCDSEPAVTSSIVNPAPICTRMWSCRVFVHTSCDLIAATVGAYTLVRPTITRKQNMAHRNIIVIL